MGQIKKIICLFSIFTFVFSCTSDYKYEFKNHKDPSNSFIVETLDNRTKMIISTAYRNYIENDLYYLRINNEFYQCDKTFSRDSIGRNVQFSTVKEYNIRSQKYNINRLTIEKVENYYITTFNLTDYSGTVSIKYYYDADYRIFKIENDGISYTVNK